MFNDKEDAAYTAALNEWNSTQEQRDIDHQHYGPCAECETEWEQTLERFDAVEREEDQLVTQILKTYFGVGGAE